MTAPEPNVAYPRPIGASGRCPSEDAGGPPGYAEMPEALGDPSMSATPRCATGWEKISTHPPSTLST
jgi:hypothetical protein